MQIVMLSKGSAKAYYAALKEQRRELALFYERHPEMPLTGVAAKFRVSFVTARTAPTENQIALDRSRNPIWGSQYRDVSCPKCGAVERHYCRTPRTPVGDAGANTSELASHPDEERWTPEQRRDIGLMSAWIEKHGRAPTLQELSDEVWKSVAPPPPSGDAPVASATPEMNALAELGLAGLMERGRKELGLE